MRQKGLKSTLDRITREMDSETELRGFVVELLNVTEELNSKLERADERIRYLEGELKKRKRGKNSGSGSDSNSDTGASTGTGAGIGGNESNKDHSSEGRRKDKDKASGSGGDRGDKQGSPKRSGRTSKANLTVHETRQCKLDKNTLPADVQYKGVDRIVVRDICIQEWNVEFEREVYYSPSEGKRYMAPLPEGWQGEFGPALKTAVITLKYDAQTSETGIVRFLDAYDIKLSSGSTSNILLDAGSFFEEEVNAILRQGYISQGYVQSDDTSARVMGKYWHTHVVCNDYFTAYFTRGNKDRLSVIDVLLGRKASQRRYRYNALTDDFLEVFDVSAKQRRRLAELAEEERDYDEAQLNALLVEQFGEKADSAAAARIREAMALTYFHQQDDVTFPETLITDGAPQYELLSVYHALCWIHEGRHYEKLDPLAENFRDKLEDFRTRYWDYYHELKAWREKPEGQRTQGEAVGLAEKFDQLFSVHTGYRELDERNAKTLAKKDQLLVVLKRPEVPLHNNASELAARRSARRRDISLHSRSQRGVDAMDNLSTIVATCRKLGIRVGGYVHKRISGLISIGSGLVAHIAARAGPDPRPQTT